MSDSQRLPNPHIQDEVQRPLGLTILSIGAFIMVPVFLMASFTAWGFITISDDTNLAQKLGDLGVPSWIVDNLSAWLIVVLVQNIGLCIAHIYIGFGFYNGIERARTLALAVIGIYYIDLVIIIFSIAFIIGLPVLLLFFIIITSILWYLTTIDVKEFFQDVSEGASLRTLL